MSPLQITQPGGKGLHWEQPPKRGYGERDGHPDGDLTIYAESDPCHRLEASMDLSFR